MGLTTLRKELLQMKKLFSAAASLVMAATMVGAVAPVGASAADAKKSLSFLAYKDATLADGVKADGATVTVSADAIAAGDVVVPVGLYLGEETADLSGIAADATVKSDSADVKKVKFKAYTPGTTKYFSSEKEFTFADGTTYLTDTVAAFAGSYDDMDGYLAHGIYNVACAESQSEAGTDNAFVGMTWTNGGKKYTWAGEKSDSLPVVVFDVTLPKGIAEGEYVIDFCNYKTAYGGNQSCMLESSTRYSSATNNLDLNTLTIKVGDASAPESSTTTTAATTTATTTTDKGGSTTTTTANQPSSGPEVPDNQLEDNSQFVADSDLVFDFTNPDDEKGYWRVNDKGVIDVAIKFDSHGKKVTCVSGFLALDGKEYFTAKFSKKSPTLGATVQTNDAEFAFNFTCSGEDGHGTASDPSNPTVETVRLTPSADIPDGLYRISFDPMQKFSVCDDTKPAAINLPVSVIPGYIAIGDVADVTTTTTTTSATTATTTTTKKDDKTTTTTTKKDDDKTTTTTTKAPTTTGDVLYGDTNCDGSVKINDVVLLNKWLNDNKSYAIEAQGKINADCYNPKNGEELTADDSDAIIKSIVHLVELPVKK